VIREPITRVAVDVGGTFTDLVTEDVAGRFHVYKSATTPDDPTRGIVAVLSLAALEYGLTLSAFLASVPLFILATTRATNAIVAGEIARTALLVTEGHPDILLWREGTRVGTFDYAQRSPEPYVSRALTFELPERIDAQGVVVRPLDEAATVALIARLRDLAVEAVAVCLLWSVLNNRHEQRVGELLRQHLPGVPFTLSSALSPTLREYRRASAASIDASLKPLMSHYLEGLEGSLRSEGFGGRLLMMTSSGGVRKLADVAASPIHSLASGPAAAPIAGRYYAMRELGLDTALVTDAGGTSYDVSLVRRGRIPWTRTTTLGASPYSPITGFPAVDVRSIGAGGGSIASVDSGGLLHVGPRSAGAVPGPACYQRGGVEPTITDACLVLGYLDPDYFLGGRMRLNLEAAVEAIDRRIARPLGLPTAEAAAAVVELQIEHMVSAIEAITVNQGVDPRGTPLIAGGGSAGFYSIAVARRLGCSIVVVPEAAAALSAVGAQLSDLSSEYLATHPTSSRDFDFGAVNDVLRKLRMECETFARLAPDLGTGHEIRFTVEARYRDQVWEIEVPLRRERYTNAAEVAELRQDFDATHEEILAHRDPYSDIEFVTWRAQVRCPLRPRDDRAAVSGISDGPSTSMRRVYFKNLGHLDTPVMMFDMLSPERPLEGPAIIQSATTTIVIDPGASAMRTQGGSIVVDPLAGEAYSRSRNVPHALSSEPA
jgi:N-methylhydantoinase A